MRTLALCIFATACTVPGKVFVSDSGTPSPPSWSEGLARFAWRELPESSLALGPAAALDGEGGSASARIDAWAGFAIDERSGTMYLAASGGDWEYAGNEVLAFTLPEDVPRWRELRASTPLSLTTRGEPYYGDGRPASRQTFYRSIFVERRGALLLFGGDVLGAKLRTVDAFDPARGDWDAAGSLPDLPFDAMGGEPAFAEDPETGDVWAFGAYQVHRFIEATSRWAAVVPSGLMQSGYDLAAALDTRRHRILLVGSTTGHAYTFSIDDHTWIDHGPIDLSGITDGGLVFVRGASELEDVFLLRGSEAGPSVISIHAETLAPSALPTTGGEAIPASQYGVFGRFRFAPSLGGVVFYPRYEGNIWFLRTSP